MTVRLSTGLVNAMAQGLGFVLVGLLVPVVALPSMTWADAGVPAGKAPTLPSNHPPGAALP